MSEKYSTQEIHNEQDNTNSPKLTSSTEINPIDYQSELFSIDSQSLFFGDIKSPPKAPRLRYFYFFITFIRPKPTRINGNNHFHVMLPQS